jgi:transposase
MNIPTKYIDELSDEMIQTLEGLIKDSPIPRVRVRAHCILLSSRGFSIDEIAEIYQMHRNSVSALISYWDEKQLESLYDLPKSGRPPILTPEEKEQVKKTLEIDPRNLKKIASEISNETQKEVKPGVIKSILREFNYVWKRIRKSPSKKRDEIAFRLCKNELEELQKEANAGNINLYYYDEAGFSLIPSISYAWQLIRETIEVKSTHSKQINVLGFLDTKNNFESFIFEESINSSVVIECFNRFCQKITKKTFIVIDNSPIHTSDDFNDMIEKWEKRGLYIKYLPPYCPELNLIEILWRMIKYYWLPFSAYENFQVFVKSLEMILIQIGSKYKITFT